MKKIHKNRMEGAKKIQYSQHLKFKCKEPYSKVKHKIQISNNIYMPEK